MENNDTQNATSIADIISNEKLVIDPKSLPNPGSRGTLEWVDPLTLYVDHDSYQRETKIFHAVKIGQNFKYEYSKVISGFRCAVTGRIFVTDGQHTSIGAALAKIPLVPVWVHDLNGNASKVELVQRQSEQFVAINSRQQKMDRYTLHRNALIQKSANALKIQAICDKTGVVLIPTSQKKKKIPGSLSHIHNAYVAIEQIGEFPEVYNLPSPMEMALTFMRKCWKSKPIDPVLFIGLARFFKQFVLHRMRNQPGAMFDEVILFSALTDGGIRNYEDIPALLDSYFAQTGATNANNGDVWRAKAIRMAYNDWVDSENLGQDKRLSAKVY